MGAVPLPEGSMILQTIRRLRAIDAEIFGTAYIASGTLGDLTVLGDITIGEGGSIEVGDIISSNWDGANPADLSTVSDPTVTEGYYLDLTAGVAHFASKVYVGIESLRTSMDGNGVDITRTGDTSITSFYDSTTFARLQASLTAGGVNSQITLNKNGSIEIRPNNSVTTITGDVGVTGFVEADDFRPRIANADLILANSAGVQKAAYDDTAGTWDFNVGLDLEGNDILDVNLIRLTSTTDVSLSSTDHGLMIGPATGANLAMDTNEVMARNNGAISTLHLNADGGPVSFQNNRTPSQGDVINWAGEEIVPRGTLLGAFYGSSSTTPGTGDTDVVTETITLDYSGQPVIVMAVGMTTTAALDEGEGYSAQIEIDATAYKRAEASLGSITQSGHTHGAGSYYVPTYGTVAGTSGSASSSTVSIGDSESAVTVVAKREFTPAGSSFNVVLQAEIDGSPATFNHSMITWVWRA